MYADSEEMVLATCEAPGSYYSVCSVCGKKSEKIIIPQLEHEYITEEHISDDCTVDSYIIKRCTLCDEVIETKLPSEGHKYEDVWTIAQEPNCTEEGIRTRACLVCGEVEKETIKPLGHAFGIAQRLMEATENEYGLIGCTCSRCEAVDVTTAIVLGKLPPKVIEAPYSASGSSSSDNNDNNSDHEESEPEPVAPSTPSTPSHTHTWVTKPGFATVTATCYSPGSDEQVCSGCGIDNPANPITLPMTAHSLSAWSPNPAGADHSRSCTNAGCIYSENENHTYGNWEPNPANPSDYWKPCTAGCGAGSDSHTCATLIDATGNCSKCGRQVH